jgi:hypothetical protein
MRNVRRSIAQLRAEKEARLQKLEEGIALRDESYRNASITRMQTLRTNAY